MVSYDYTPGGQRNLTPSMTQFPEPLETTEMDGADYSIMPPTLAFEPEIDITTLSLDELSTSPLMYNREISWLDFNWRVLYEALDERNPLLERLKFLAITASNLDEFFRKRVGGLKRQQAAGMANLTSQGLSPDFQIRVISQAIHRMVRCQSDCLLDQVLPALRAEGMRICDYGEINDEGRTQLQTFFHREIYPILTPLAVDPGHPFPFISNLSLNLAVELFDPISGETHFARIKVPPNRARWISVGDQFEFVPLEQIMIQHLGELFGGMEIVSAHPFRVTRNADMARNEEEADDLLEMISEEVRERRFAPIVRLEVVDQMPEHLRQILMVEMGLSQSDVYEIRGPLGLADLFSLADANLPHLKYEPWTPQSHPAFAGLTKKSRPADIFAIIRKGDVLVHHPYHSFATSTQAFLEAASRDPQVLAIKQTLYRTSSDSPIVKALIAAAERGKQVAVLVELKARFDEERNIEWARTLEDAGVHVAYGLIGLKTHTKTTLVVREEEDGLRAYAHVGTGNYNPKTASLYTDLGLMTASPEIAADLMDLFNFLTGYSRQQHYRKLLVAPITMRRRFIEMIESEMAHALAGRPARIIAKMNGLDDPEIVRKLYEASQAGVPVLLIVRGNCRIRPGLPGISENIQVYSIIGRFLEHHRIFYFENGGDPLYFIGSADWMTRNLSNRVEAITPIEDPNMQRQLQTILEVCLADKRQAWKMMPDGRYRRRRWVEDAEVASLGTHQTLMDLTRFASSQV
ncbi:MAG: polyphosphate kinase 1 [Caldilineaceae bacterium]|nr:polyphosphate kinase 1 [Caldilineaceae bacterium]